MIAGTAAADGITGTTGDDVIDGQAGADVIDGGHGNDTSSGGAPARAMERPSCLTMMPMASKIPLIAHGNQ
ncbi:hemolysin-type calcium-binding region [Verminephrobacter eiseniae]|uniref:Hemolysin-type calcium-binding region n=1 Tax=Verminephrobacter eiseniae (strain EF01-2) TaxID=391735 RepID=A1WPE9_VEREI|nr:hemolysin-type calcium-binding region [Verminephrobacter eiseniae]ABM59506.1 Hemolysin-type calcium-binding region [Verminephrobacter eiseniae EF01-2]MCW5285031.1 hypothetical protein [Verminephrobacter eiseniae]MCW5302738.1 hypothetical protein [Verminephrobacter eiseniae]